MEDSSRESGFCGSLIRLSYGLGSNKFSRQQSTHDNIWPFMGMYIYFVFIPFYECRLFSPSLAWELQSGLDETVYFEHRNNKVCNAGVQFMLQIFQIPVKLQIIVLILVFSTSRIFIAAELRRKAESI